ncbi:MAG: leucine-rich repeat domain-containing protein, partial [Ruminococcus sp.]|nr:leucine-rich repeat domain-containing protein [Ruminococcus sp.]
MKRRLAFLLAIVMIFGTAAAGCGKKDKSSGAQKAAEASAEEIPYEEELPLANELIHEAPIPADTGTLELTEQSYDDMGLMLRLPSDVTAQQTEEGITVTDDAGSWTMSFTPFTQGEYYTRRAAADHGSGDSREYREADRCDTEFKGFQGFISTANIQSTGYSVNDGERIPELDLLLDYGSEYVGKWAGVQVTLRPTGSYSDTNIYELLYLRHIRALLNGFEPVKDYGAETVSAGGITASLPARWAPKADEDSGAVTAHIVNGSDRGGLLITSVSASDPAAYAKKQAELTGAEVFAKSCGSVSCTGFIRKLTSSSVDEYDEKKKTETCIAELYSDMGGGRAVRTVVSLRGADSEELNAFLDSGVFTDALSTVTADAAGYTASEGGGSFTCDEYGLITGYSGGSAVTVPTEVNGVTVTGIADGALKSSSITSIDFPAGVTEIGSKAFGGCAALAGTSFSEGLMFIDNAAFSGCKSLNDVSLPETVSYVGCEAFAKAGKGSFSCAGEPKFDSKALYASAFGDIYTAGGDLGAAKVMNSCKAVSIKLGEGVEKLGYDCMSDCEKLTSVTLPHGLKKLGKYCMSYDPKLHRVDIPERVELIPEGCFSETRLDVLVLPENVTGMEHYAVTNAAYLAICNREIKLGMEAFNVERVYLEGVYLSEDVPRG